MAKNTQSKKLVETLTHEEASRKNKRCLAFLKIYFQIPTGIGGKGKSIHQHGFGCCAKLIKRQEKMCAKLGEVLHYK